MSAESAQLDALHILVSSQTTKLSQQIQELTERITTLTAQCADMAATTRTAKKPTKASSSASTNQSLPFAITDDDNADAEIAPVSSKAAAKAPRSKVSAVDEFSNALISHMASPLVTKDAISSWRSDRGDMYKGIRTESKIKDMHLQYANMLPESIRAKAVMFVASRT